MSNWSLVIVGWSSVDQKAEAYGHHRRAAEIAGAIGKQREYDGIPFTYIPPCGKGSMGGTCEVITVMHVNHFSLTDEWADGKIEDRELLKLLKSWEWEYPEQVVVMSKDEGAEKYDVVYPLEPSQ